MKAIKNIGRILFALAFAAFGIVHLIMGAKFGGNVPGFFRFGSGAFWVYLTGIAYILACISIIINVKTALACTLLGALVFLIALTVHLPGMIHSSGMQSIGQLSNFIKAIAIGAGAWYIAGSYAWSGSGASEEEATP